ncbi:CCR4-NOT transcription complex subunit 3-like [Rhodamnia argentea]|uniref:CCR4-NOT transcription complex subunit 3-like n=1 Tax=Rhodamnia argentea TaxID=178133 RepID=A0ABM3HQR1_9MYRT|nr:CCR4-NOT transcription complex subunit 3-like [Rhodamnia argentea]XP_048138937.1 CCR4-NOT transcription complex subunit 3-like [Rhodamnia argentea]XP_048138938.1 CCR4-NOT transcription complex subunit 3-like [Rhodamnia argentea]XP_048138939.1 CCR4-NOT transcription complex subunit 3-like [Rhodamnia argentea]
MGASRKLQAEIDRVLKKVQDGVEVFDGIWNKVYDTDNANQKEKLEADLKKEIKKLQRYRDQIKTWTQSSEIKDKKVSASYEQSLVDARKLIEREMERFKICEKETKMKAFSKEGLGQQPRTDPKEKAKSETRDWINNVVGELETQIDVFEAEIEGLSVKKGKTRPPRLTHLETSIARHKAHIMKLELILRLLDNNELSPEQVNDLKDFLDDYVERNQDDFDEFGDVDEFYNSLPLEKVEALEELVTLGPPGLLKGTPVLSLKSSPMAAAPHLAATTTTAHQQEGSLVQEEVEDTSSKDANSDNSAGLGPTKASTITFAVSTPMEIHADSVTSNILSHSPPGVSTASTVLPGSTQVCGVLESAGPANSSTLNFSTTGKEEEDVTFSGRQPSPSLNETEILNGMVGGALASQLSSSMTPADMLPGSGTNIVPPYTSDIAKRNILEAEERLGSSGTMQSLVSPLDNRIILPQGLQANEVTGYVDSGSGAEGASLAGRIFSPPLVTGMEWRPGSSFNQNQLGYTRRRTEIAPDQRERFLQRFQQMQQQGHSVVLGMPFLAGGNQKQFSARQQGPPLQQFNSQSSSISPQVSVGIGLQMPGLNTVSDLALQRQLGSIHQQFSQLSLALSGPRDSEVSNGKILEQPGEQNLPNYSGADSAVRSGVGKNTMNEDDLVFPQASDAGLVDSFAEPAQVPRDTDVSPGQPHRPTLPSRKLGFIGRRSISDLGAVGDNFGSSNFSYGGYHNQIHNHAMLEAAFYKLPQRKDSDRRRPVDTPPSFPQVQAPIVKTNAFWERLGREPCSVDTLFFAFYYQQNTYQQCMAAKELKKQSWRYHKKHNTWFKRHDEPTVATGQYEQGSYIYFDFNASEDDTQPGWCQRIKKDFTFDYRYLEEDLVL